MWHYLPDTAIVNNIEFDHADIYRDEEAYKLRLRAVHQPDPGRTARWSRAGIRRSVRELAPRNRSRRSRVVRLPTRAADATASTPRWQAVDVDFGTDEHTLPRRCTTARSGARSRRRWRARSTCGTAWPRSPPPNPSAPTARAYARGCAPSAACGDGMEVRGEVRGITVIDDFAHHPTAVRETIDAVRQRYAGRPIVAVFEPRSYTAQRREFQEPYRARAFGGRPDRARGALPSGALHGGDGARPARAGGGAGGRRGSTADYIPELDEIVAHLTAAPEGRRGRADHVQRRLRRDPPEAAGRDRGWRLALSGAAPTRGDARSGSRSGRCGRSRSPRGERPPATSRASPPAYTSAVHVQLLPGDRADEHPLVARPARAHAPGRGCPRCRAGPRPRTPAVGRSGRAARARALGSPSRSAGR